ncbi:hypothetical protein QBC33DRAFT_516355 [Phialemonium atrogriseum]|uniref:Integral membrane protein n=1 Tax=Phialemonium atrogriseum TaxID=1093897 RepID=A0AAJ0BWU5_9PEZI|nr:uncharacterized protein QBC33DRAFT_516355 [Phialemonium atrogriseum]KAK1765938.1 hypothetical protein QBC33DRAFT_516355 [Phialemonium atrogriseum]
MAPPPPINLTIWFLVDAILGQRIYSKFLHHRPLWWDDYVLISAWVNSDSGEGSATPKRTGESVQASIIAASVLATVPTVFGYGRHSWDVAPADLTRGWRAVWVCIATLNLAMGAIAVLLAGITSIVKITNIHTIESAGIFDGVAFVLWPSAESTITVVAASIPILRVLIRDVPPLPPRLGKLEPYWVSNVSGLGTDVPGWEKQLPRAM